MFGHRHGGQAKQDNGIRRFHCSDGRIADLGRRGREGERDSRFFAAFSPRLAADVRNRKGKMRVGNDGPDCRRDDALVDGGRQENSGSLAQCAVIPNEQTSSHKASLYLEQLT